MEIRFIFDEKEAYNELVQLKAKYDFDDRNGLSNVMIGEHWSEIEEDNRLIHQIESILNIELSLLDYWSLKVFDSELEIDDVQEVLIDLKSQIQQKPTFYHEINCRFDLKELYFKSQFIRDINFLIERIEISKINGAQKIKYEIE